MAGIPRSSVRVPCLRKEQQTPSSVPISCPAPRPHVGPTLTIHWIEVVVKMGCTGGTPTLHQQVPVGCRVACHEGHLVVIVRGVGAWCGEAKQPPLLEVLVSHCAQQGGREREAVSLWPKIERNTHMVVVCPFCPPTPGPASLSSAPRFAPRTEQTMCVGGGVSADGVSEPEYLYFLKALGKCSLLPLQAHRAQRPAESSKEREDSNKGSVVVNDRVRSV